MSDLRVIPGHGKGRMPKNGCCIVAEYVGGGTLSSYLWKNRIRKLPLNVVIQLALDAAKGLCYLHSQKVVHRDVKTDNMLLDNSRRVKIIDFGVSRYEALNPTEMTAQTGTTGYMAPEVLCSSPYDHKCDVFSFGICLWEIYCCARPNFTTSFRPVIPENCPSSLANLMNDCWDADPKRRPEMAETPITKIWSFCGSSRLRSSNPSSISSISLLQSSSTRSDLVSASSSSGIVTESKSRASHLVFIRGHIFRMSLQQVVQPRSASNGFSRRRAEKDSGPRLEGKLQTGKVNLSRSSSIGVCQSASRERLVYLTTCLIGHQVEVQVLDGSVFSGIFHATDAEKDFGIILKMAHLTKDGSRGQKKISDSINKPPSNTVIIPAKELVQVIAKGVPVTREGLANELQREKQQELLIDSSISQSRRVEMERELERWVPADDDPVCPELENIFDGHWDRSWDQFQANETLFGVKSTFDEEIYTTKLEKGPQMKELEREALRVAREIEGEDTHDLHLAEERGLQLHENFDVDEEIRFSSVLRGVDDSVYDDIDDILLDTHDDETFGGSYVSGVGNASVKSHDGAQALSRSSPLEEAHSSLSTTSREVHQSGSDDHISQLSAGHLSKDSLTVGDNRVYEHFANHAATSYCKDDAGNQVVSEEAQTSKLEDSWSSLQSNIESSDKGGLSAKATAYAPSSEGQEKPTSNELSEGIGFSKAQGTAHSASSRVRPSTASSTLDHGGGASASSGPGLSPSLSMGSLSSEKSTLNPHAKEFKLNPNAKSFIPSQSPLRPASPVSDGSFYYPANMTAVPHMHGMPVGIGIGPSFSAHQPVIFNPQAAPVPAPQPYFHPSGPQYGRQMMIGHPQQVVYMPPTYNPEMPYKGREF
ncbi:hypothetical protein ACH5RR_007920 [Cinchona calisaya]|uniref:Protein kinase domain-containing protein n=1 Tax=Cinchona calisaya TaxID=153742 RepID=A0ABD3AAM5_9GENT